MESENFYKLLDVEQNADDETIKKAFRKLAMQYHPDKNQGNKESEEKFKNINEAYETLSDKNKREEYNNELKYGKQHRHNGFNGFGNGGINIQDFMRNMANNTNGTFFTFGNGGQQTFHFETNNGFNNFGNMRFTKRPTINTDIKTNLNIDLATALSGGSIDISVKRFISCEKCYGTGKKMTDETCTHCKGNNQHSCQHCEGHGKKVEPCKECDGDQGTYSVDALKLEIPQGILPMQTLKAANMGNVIYENKNKKTTGNLFINVMYSPQQGNFELRNEGLVTALRVPLHFVLEKKKVQLNVLGIKEIEFQLDHHDSEHIYSVVDAFNLKNKKIPLLVKVFIETPRISNLKAEDKENLQKVLTEIYGKSI